MLGRQVLVEMEWSVKAVMIPVISISFFGYFTSLRASPQEKTHTRTTITTSTSRTQTHYSTTPQFPLPTAAAAVGVPSFSEFSLSDLKATTNNFSPDYIVFESGERAPNQHAIIGGVEGGDEKDKAVRRMTRRPKMRELEEKAAVLTTYCDRSMWNAYQFAAVIKDLQNKVTSEQIAPLYLLGKSKFQSVRR
ncbi:hypothetical protein Vadar_034196 [Vaccinium darrowii]|uniref:Uncharacterized protein n=1 Tax=Vaccinium darrowii TaxID=229202 RepID=A0ACB7YII0_9ERIC|nr:hypothetical protein Vadar_034196 [Vaccinium darrowii]